MNRFVKLDAADQPLPQDAQEWVGVLDTQLNLIWDKDHLPKEMTQKQAEAAVKKAKGGRRLPTVEELFLLADRTRYRPAAYTEFFPDTASDWYRTSSPFVGAAGYSWIVSFLSGYSLDVPRDGGAFVRLVRSAPSVPGQ